MTLQTPRPNDLPLTGDLAAIVGDGHVITDPAERAFYSQDVYSAGTLADLVVRPGSVEELSKVVALATSRDYAVVPRGGGMSYTSGYTPVRERTLVVDTQRLDRIIDINDQDMTVTVECGVTWRALWEALSAKGLRTPFWGPLSGIRATIGGSLSQNSTFFGAGQHGPTPESVLALEVVLADGTLVATGSGGTKGAKPFFRHYGPDLTGLFLGDTGALGFKARITLRLMKVLAHQAWGSFAFDERDAMAKAMAAIAREGIASECFGFDPGLQKQRMKRQSLMTDLNALKNVAAAGSSLVKGLTEAAKIAVAGRRFMDDVLYSCHIVTEARLQIAADTAMDDIRAIVKAHGGREIENTIPKVTRADPFVPTNSMLGPEGERWVPVHGIVPLSQAAETWGKIDALFASYADRCQAQGVETGYLVTTISTNAFLIEPVFYWPDARLEIHDRSVESAYLSKLKVHAPNAAAAGLVAEMRDGLKKLFLEQGAAHFQIGKAYLYREGRKPETWALLDAIKKAVDPKGLINPGSLGF